MKKVAEAEKVIYRFFGEFEDFLRLGPPGVGVISRASRVQIQQTNSHFGEIMMF